MYIDSTFLDLDKTVIKKTTLPDSTPTKTQNKIVSNLEEPDEMKKSTAINLRLLPFHASRTITTAAIFPENLKESKRFILHGRI